MLDIPVTQSMTLCITFKGPWSQKLSNTSKDCGHIGMGSFVYPSEVNHNLPFLDRTLGADLELLSL